MLIIPVGQVHVHIIGYGMSATPIAGGSEILRHVMREECIALVIPVIIRRAHTGLPVKQRPAILGTVDQRCPIPFAVALIVFVLKSQDAQFVVHSPDRHRNYRHLAGNRLELETDSSLCFRISIVFRRGCNSQSVVFFRNGEGHLPSGRLAYDMVQQAGYPHIVRPALPESDALIPVRGQTVYLKLHADGLGH